MTKVNLNEKLIHSKLYVLLSNIGTKPILLEKARQVLDGGADIIQLREKLLPDKEFFSIAEDLLNLTFNAGAILIINDRVHIAKQIDADGVHLGQEDIKIEVARSILGEDKIIGISTHNFKQALEARNSCADYIAIGPVFTTQTKDYEPDIGTEITHEVAKNLEIPTFAIGGINLSNIDQVIMTGISKVAISSAIVDSKDVANSTRKFKNKLIRT